MPFTCKSPRVSCSGGEDDISSVSTLRTVFSTLVTTKIEAFSPKLGTTSMYDMKDGMKSAESAERVAQSGRS